MVSQSILRFYDKRMKWTKDPKVPHRQGAWIQQLIDQYPGVRIMEYAIDGSRIGLKDNKGTKAFWKCDGVTLTPLGKIVKNIKNKRVSKS